MHMLNIGIDISSLVYQRGVSRYTTNLIRELAVAAATDTSAFNLHLLGYSRRQFSLLQEYAESIEQKNTTQHLFKYPPKVMDMLWNRLHIVPAELFTGALDVFHSWDIQPPLKKAKLVTTIHDLAMLKFPQTAHPDILAMHKNSWKWMKKQNASIIAVSEATKNDIVELLNIEPEKITVIREALPIETQFHIQKEESLAIQKKYGISKPYILFVGTLEPRKNLKRLLQAYEILKSRKTDLQLVIAGSDGWEQISPKTDIIRAEKPSSHDLAALFSGAEVLAYPSLYEGFGLPILEAFWYGVPVVTSDVSSLPEVGGAAAVYVDPHEADAIADGIQTAVKKKKELIQKGKKQLKKFSWKTAAQQTLDVYRKAYFMESGKREKQNK